MRFTMYPALFNKYFLSVLIIINFEANLTQKVC